MGIRRLRAVVAAITLGVVLVGGMTPAWAEERGTWGKFGLGVAAMLSNAVYMPLKLGYAGLGAVTGGITYALTGGSRETADNVWVASMGGDYVVVPDNLTGDKPLEFSSAAQDQKNNDLGYTTDSPY
jgi:hypothetical protein